MNLLIASAFALYCSVVFAAPKCGKPSLKVKYGQSKVFTSPNLESGTCKYRMKVGTGLSIKLTLREYSTDHSLTVYDGTAKPFNARKAKRFSVPSPPQPSGKVLQFDTHSVVMKLGISAGSSPTSFTYEAVLPADGNFGYDTRALAKAKTIRTPGFPKLKLPSGIQSTWNIRCGENEAILLSFISLRTASDADYVEVHDGDALLGRHSGRVGKRNPVEHIAHSGSLRITLHTTSSQSKGFKVKYRALKAVNTTTISTSELTCHKRNRVMSKTVTSSDSHSSMTCGSNEVCGRMVMEGTSSRFSSLTITSEVMSCIPRNLCSGPADACSTTPPSSEITVNSCAVTCCNTDLCNGSPDGPDVPPSPVPGATTPPVLWPPQPSVLRCNYESEIQVEGGPNQGSGSDGLPCPHGGVCGLFVFKGNSRGNAAQGYVATCTTRSQCNGAGCSSLPDASGITINTCEATCCSTDYCNRRTTPPPPSISPPEQTLQCYNILFSQTSDIVLINEKRPKACYGESKCVLMEATATDNLGRQSKSMFGDCIPEVACDHLNCDLLQNALGVASVESCNFKCCGKDLCNDNADEPRSEQPGTLLKCHRMGEYVQEGAVALSNPDGSPFCQAGDMCARYIFRGTSTKSHEIGEPIAGQVAKCAPRSDCNKRACSNLTEAREVRVTSCEVTCCSTTECNKLQETPMPSPRPGSALQCYDLLTSTAGSMKVLDKKNVITCDVGESCFRIDALSTHRRLGMNITAAYGGCIPQRSCDSLDCSSVPRGSTPGVEITGCSAQCCNTPLCNERSEAIGPVISTPSGGLQCYNMLSSTAGGNKVLDKKDLITCGADESCFRIDAQATHDELGFKITTAYGGCIPQIACGALDCSQLPSQPGVQIDKCSTSCCDTPRCNENPPTDSVTIAPQPASRLRCYQQSEVARDGARDIGIGSDDAACPAGNMCGLFVFTGSENGVSVSGYVSTCVPQSDCNSERCSSLPATTDIDITSCKAKCCNTDMCNQHDGAAPTPSVAPASGGVRQCYDITSSIVGTITAIDKKETMMCDDPEARCMRLDAAGTDSLGNQVTMAFGRCVPAVSCGAVNCRLMAPSMPGVSMRSCNAGCCSTDLCNGEELTSSAEPVSRLTPTPPMVESGVSIQCYEGTEIKGLGRAFSGGSRSAKQCTAGSRCLAMKATATHSAFSGIKLEVNYGACMASELCEHVTCDSLPTSMSGVTLGSCDASCCDSDLCNA